MSLISFKNDWLRGGLLALVYFAAAQIGLKLALSHHTVTLFWPPSGIALAALLILGWRVFPAIIIGEFFAILGNDMSVSGAFGIACGNAVEGLLGYYWLHRFGFDVRMRNLRDVGMLFVFGVVLSPPLAAVNGALWVWLATGGSWIDGLQTVQYWWMGDALGIALFTPLILSWLRGDTVRWTRERVRRGVFMAFVLLVACAIFFFDLPNHLLQFGLLFPLLIWISLNFDLRCVSSALLLIFFSSMLGMLDFDDLSAANMDVLLNFVWLYNLLFALTALSVTVLNAQRSRSERALHVSEDNLKRAQEIGGVGSWHLDLTTNQLQWTEETYRIFGIAQGAPLDYRIFLQHVHPDDRALVDSEWRQALQGKPYDIEHRILVGDKVKWIHEKADMDFDADSRQAVSAIGTVRDITRHKQEEAALRLAARVFESSGEAILITDDKASIVAVNHAFIEMTGYRREEVMGKNPKILASGRHDTAFYRAMWDDLNHFGYWQGDIWDKHKGGRIYPKWMSITAVRDELGNLVNYVSIARDITEKKDAEKNIHLLAYYDVLTGLPNRTLLRDRLGQLLAAAHRDKQQFAILFLDLDRFKYINDSMGHSVGDRLLQSVAQRIQENVRECDTVARLGGDEFIVLLRDAGESAAAIVAKKLLTALSNPFDLDGQVISTHASIGISIYPDHAQDTDTLIKSADMAMYHAKEEGRGNFQFFTPDMNFRVDLLFSMEKDLRLALERGEFFLQYQAQADLTTGALCGVEALIRWNHPVKGLIPPDDFIQVAEETGQIVAIGEWVLRTACAQQVAWRKQGLGDFPIAVNLSMRQLRQPTLGDLVRSVLKECALEPQYLELEITEGIMMGDNKSALQFLAEMHELGVRLSIDDFGTGFSSLNYLKKLPVDKLKIDQTFVSDIETDESNAAIIRSIISLGHRLNLRVIAEGVETQEQLDFLRIRGCDEIQGYFYSRPLSAEAFLEFANNSPKLL
ncbi:MAG: EAL domain-containing protein [Sideroxydans sp.]|nr:EAL domain-containing protein [Sideroxydans sp.]